MTMSSLPEALGYMTLLQWQSPCIRVHGRCSMWMPGLSFSLQLDFQRGVRSHMCRQKSADSHFAPRSLLQGLLRVLRGQPV
jgi:hypothetical protein